MGNKSPDMRKIAVFILALLLGMSLLAGMNLLLPVHKTLISAEISQQEETFNREESAGENGKETNSVTGMMTESEGSETGKNHRISPYRKKLRTEIRKSAMTEAEASEQRDSGERDSGNTDSDTETLHRKWSIYIEPDMPVPFLEVLMQYEDFLNADVRNLDDAVVREKINAADGEWRYLLPELCGMFLSCARHFDEEQLEETLCYSLKDLTGDGFPELIMGFYWTDTVSVYGVYYYSEAEGIKMEYASSYYTMNLYEGGIIEYAGAGVSFSITYFQFKEDSEEWIAADKVVMLTPTEENSISDTSKLLPRYYYQGVRKDLAVEPVTEEEYAQVSGSFLSDGGQIWRISEDEYRRIRGRYIQKPLKLKWNQLVIGSGPVITELEIERKNAESTGDIRISSYMCKLWLKEGEDGAGQINAAFQEIYEEAEAEMEKFNHELLEDYLFEDGMLSKQRVAELTYSLDEWLDWTTVSYAAHIKYADKNYLCLSMYGYCLVAGSAHGSYWSDYYVFDRHTGRRLTIGDFVWNSPEEIKALVKKSIIAAAPYSHGAQSEKALEQDRFFLTKEGLGIHYDVYEIGSYAEGDFDLVIPFDEFEMRESANIGGSSD